MDNKQSFVLNVGRCITLINTAISTLNAIPADFDEMMYQYILNILNHEDISADCMYIEHATKNIHTHLSNLFQNSNDFGRVSEFTVLFATLLADMRNTISQLPVERPYEFCCVKSNVLIIKANLNVHRQINPGY